MACQVCGWVVLAVAGVEAGWTALPSVFRSVVVDVSGKEARAAAGPMLSSHGRWPGGCWRWVKPLPPNPKSS